MSGSQMVAGTCVVDTDAVRRFGRLARQAGSEINGLCGVTSAIAAQIADLVPHSAAISLWCESTSATTDLVKRSADHLGGLADRADHAVAAFAEADFARGRLLAGLEVRI